MNEVTQKTTAGLPAQSMFEDDASKGLGNISQARLSLTFS